MLHLANNMYLPIFKPIFIQKLKWVYSEMVVDSRAYVMIFIYFFLQVIHSNNKKKINHFVQVWI